MIGWELIKFLLTHYNRIAQCAVWAVRWPCGILAYLIFVICFTRAKFLENKIYTEKMRKLRQNTQKIANFLRYYGKIHSKLPIFCVKSVKIYTGQKNLHENSRGFRDKYEVWLYGRDK